MLECVQDCGPLVVKAGVRPWLDDGGAMFGQLDGEAFAAVGEGDLHGRFSVRFGDVGVSGDDRWSTTGRPEREWPVGVAVVERRNRRGWRFR